jgi:hypothetical protein
MRPWFRIAVGLVTVVAGATISYRSDAAPVLTRSGAATIIERSAEVQGRRSEMCLRLDWRDRAKGLGLVSNGQFTPPLAAYIGQLVGTCGAILKQRVATPRVTVTGIAEISPTIKQAQFTWAYHSLPAPLRPVASLGGYGNATFQLFDDGWRAVGVTIRNGDATYPSTAAEEAQIAAGNRQSTNMIALSKVVHRLIATSSGLETGELYDSTFLVKNGNVVQCEMWFGNIDSFETFDDQSYGRLRAKYRIFGIDQTDVRDRCPHLNGELRFDSEAARQSFLNAANNALAAWRQRFPGAWLR